MSELGDSADIYRSSAAVGTTRSGGQGPKRTVDAPVESAGWGRGPAAPDRRKFKYDVIHARTQAPIPFSVSKVDRLDAEVAGDMLHRLMTVFGIGNEDETRQYAFMNALFFQHTLNGGSILQPGRGVMRVDGVEFDMTIIGQVLGLDARRFYRAYADEIADVNQRVVDECDPMEPASMEMYGQLMQVAQERGLQKYPKFAHDSADACLHMSIEERRAVIIAKRLTLLSNVNRADMVESNENAIRDREAQVT